MRAFLATLAVVVLGWSGVAYPCDEAGGDGPIAGEGSDTVESGPPVPEAASSAGPRLVLVESPFAGGRPLTLDVSTVLERPRVLDLGAAPRTVAVPPLDFRTPAPALRARPDWGWTDTALQAAVGLGLLADYVQTRRIVRDGCELNPVIGRHGGRVRPGVYFPVVFAVSTATAHALPPEWRRALQGVLIGTQGATVYRNWARSGRNPFRW